MLIHRIFALGKELCLRCRRWLSRWHARVSERVSWVYTAKSGKPFCFPDSLLNRVCQICTRNLSRLDQEALSGLPSASIIPGIHSATSVYSMVSLCSTLYLQAMAFMVCLAEGVNGRLPNQDLLNSVQVISRWTGGVPVMVYNHPNEPRAHHHSEHPVLKQFDSLLNRHAVKEYEMRAKNILTHVAYQSRGSPSGVHGLFHQ